MAIEIVGIAGAGKSSIVRGLTLPSNSKSGLQVSKKLSIRQLSTLVISICIAFFLAPMNRHWILSIRSIYWLQKFSFSQNDKVVLFDQGPVFHLAFLNSVGSGYKPNLLLRFYIRLVIPKIAERISNIIVLQVSLGEAYRRCKSREKLHSLQTRSPQSAERFLLEFERSYNFLCQEFGRRGVSVDCVETDGQPVDDTIGQVEKLLSECGYA